MPLTARESIEQHHGASIRSEGFRPSRTVDERTQQTAPVRREAESHLLEFEQGIVFTKNRHAKRTFRARSIAVSRRVITCPKGKVHLLYVN
jgi:hypothetical protein